MGKKIKVVTKCGEVSFHDFDQDVDTVEIIEEPNPKRGTYLDNKTHGGWTVSTEEGYYITDDDGSYFYIRNKNGDSVASIYKREIDGEVKLG